MKPDKSIDNMHERIDKIESSAASDFSSDDDGNYNRLDKYDDEYYLDQNRDPPRFLLYRQARAEKWKELELQGHHKPSEHDGSFTQDELDYALKRELRKTEEQRYQEEKRNFLFHDLSCYMKGLGEQDYGCTGAGCIPECRFYPEQGRIEDDVVIEQYKKIR